MRGNESNFSGPEIERDPSPWVDACGGAWPDVCAGRCRRRRSCCDYCWVRSSCPYADGRGVRD